MIVKLFLISGVVAALAWLLRGSSSAHRLVAARLGGLLLALVWVAAVLNPDLVSLVANAVGVGRGTDLVLYVLVVAFLMVATGQYLRIHALEDRVASLTRAHALLEATRPVDKARTEE